MSQHISAPLVLKRPKVFPVTEGEWLRSAIDLLVTDAIAGVLVDLIEGHALARRCRRIERDGARDQRQLEKALPVGAGAIRNHAIQTPRQASCGVGAAGIRVQKAHSPVQKWH